MSVDLYGSVGTSAPIVSDNELPLDASFESTVEKTSGIFSGYVLYVNEKEYKRMNSEMKFHFWVAAGTTLGLVASFAGIYFRNSGLVLTALIPLILGINCCSLGLKKLDVIIRMKKVE